jgi:hypothetical protein
MTIHLPTSTRVGEKSGLPPVLLDSVSVPSMSRSRRGDPDRQGGLGIVRLGAVLVTVSERPSRPNFTARTAGTNPATNETLAVIAGKLRPRATGLVMEWATEHRDERRRIWEQARHQEPLDQVDPLP